MTKNDIPSLMEKAYKVMNEEFQQKTQEAIKNFMVDQKTD